MDGSLAIWEQILSAYACPCNLHARLENLRVNVKRTLEVALFCTDPRISTRTCAPADFLQQHSFEMVSPPAVHTLVGPPRPILSMEVSTARMPSKSFHLPRLG